MPAWVCISDTGLCLMLCITQKPVRSWLLWCGDGAVPRVRPCAAWVGVDWCQAAEWQGVGMEDLHFQQDRCSLSFLPNLCLRALFLEVVNTTLRARLRLQQVISLMPWDTIMGFLAVVLRLMEEMCGEDVFNLWDGWTFLERLSIAEQPIAPSVTVVTQTFSLGDGQAAYSEMVALSWERALTLRFVHLWAGFFPSATLM